MPLSHLEQWRWIEDPEVNIEISRNFAERCPSAFSPGEPDNYDILPQSTTTCIGCARPRVGECVGSYVDLTAPYFGIESDGVRQRTPKPEILP